MGSPAEQSLERLLGRAVLLPRPYTDRELQEAESRLATLVTDRMLRGALCLDDQIRDGLDGLDGRQEARRTPQRGPARGTEAARHLRMLCRTLIEQEGALQHMSAFLGRCIPQPAGARVLGCVLEVAGREDSARFWWQFAAGAGDAAAAYCLYLHHLALGEAWEAELWRRQADPDHGAADDGSDGSSPGLVLRVLTRLRGDGGAFLTAAATAVIHYVPEAVNFVDEIELPLPEAGFAQRIEELTATA